MNFLKEAKEIANEIYDDLSNERDAVGGEDTKKIERDGETYEINVSAFWESSSHFDYNVIGISINYSEGDTCIDF